MGESVVAEAVAQPGGEAARTGDGLTDRCERSPPSDRTQPCINFLIKGVI
jgi:hypothetical protein